MHRSLFKYIVLKDIKDKAVKFNHSLAIKYMYIKMTIYMIAYTFYIY